MPRNVNGGKSKETRDIEILIARHVSKSAEVSNPCGYKLIFIRPLLTFPDNNFGKCYFAFLCVVTFSNCLFRFCSIPDRPLSPSAEGWVIIFIPSTG